MTNGNSEQLGKASGLSRRLLALLVGLLATVTLIASGAPSAAAQTRVGAQPQNLILAVGIQSAAAQTSTGVDTVSQLRLVSATGVAADAGADGAGDAATSCLNSFTGDTPVTMADGTQEPISKVKVGDKVLATDPITGQTKAEPVAALIRHTGQHAMVLMTLADGSVLDATDGHKIWDATQHTFVDADQLRAGDKIETDTGALITVTALTGYSANLTAYNLQIDQIHTYYAGTTPVLVHNSCGMLGEDGTQVTSKTLTPGNRPYRIDVENPAPGARPGQLHLQARGGKYLYNFDTGEFEGLPGSLARQISNDPAVTQAIAKGKLYLGVN